MKLTRTRRFVLLAATLAAALGVAEGWHPQGDTSIARPVPRDRSARVPPAANLKVTAESAGAYAHAPNLMVSRAFADPASPQPSQTPSAAPRAERNPQLALAELDTGLIAQRVSAEPLVADAFVSRTWAPPPPPAPPPAPPPPPPPPPPPQVPQAPPLPFKYLGKMEISAEQAVWYLAQGERLIVVADGEVIDATYKVEGYAGGQLRFRYLPLDTPQSLVIGDRP